MSLPLDRQLAYLRLARTEQIGPVPMSVDELVEAANAPVRAVHLVLLELELAGRLTQEPSGKICLI